MKLTLDSVRREYVYNVVVSLPRGEEPPAQGICLLDKSKLLWRVGHACRLDSGVLANPPSPMRRWRFTLSLASRITSDVDVVGPQAGDELRLRVPGADKL